MSSFVVRYGLMRILGVMNARHDAQFRRGMNVIVRSDRGLEVGLVLCEATDDALSHLDRPVNGQIVRQLSDDDVGTVDSIDQARQYKITACKKHIDTLKLDMKLIDVETLFGGERMVVFYLSEERVDFRELVKLLAAEFRTRIEMKQIGIRDEAKILADYGDCGQPVCCNNHLVTMPPVSMRMARLQKATLDPTKISGRCGRLKCCLRYEFDTYDEIQKQLPRVGAHIVTRDGQAKVLNQRIITEQLLVEMEDRRRVVIDASEVLSIIKKPTQSDRESGKKEQKEIQKAPEQQQEGKRKRPPTKRKQPKDTGSEKRAKDTGDPKRQSQGKRGARKGKKK